MVIRFFTRSGFVAGLAVGLLVGLGMLLGAVAAAWHLRRPALEFPFTPLHATATDSGDNFTMATGPIADGVEGVFFLDSLTGDLQCWVVNGRTGTLTGGRFRHNVVADLNLDRTKQPKLLMVTGTTNFRTGGGALTPAECVVYVADATTGRFAAYGVPWNRNAAAVNAGQVNTLFLIGRDVARNVELRP